MFSGAFWKSAFERAFKTFFQTLAALLTGDNLGVLDVNWGDILSIAAMAAIISLATSLGSAPLGQRGTPSLTRDPAAAGYDPSHTS